MQIVKGWEIRDDGTIRHLHPGTEQIGTLVDYGRQKVCSYCNQWVPKLVKRVAQQGRKNRTMTARKKTTTKKKEEKVTEVPAKQGLDMTNLPDIPTPEAPDLDEEGIPEYTTEPLVGVRFKGGRPSEEVREAMKATGWRFHKYPDPVWIAPDGFGGLPFKVK